MSFMSRVSSHPYETATFGEKLALNMIAMTILPFSADDRRGLLISLLANQLLQVNESDDAIDATLDEIRREIKRVRWLNQMTGRQP